MSDIVPKLKETYTGQYKLEIPFTEIILGRQVPLRAFQILPFFFGSFDLLKNKARVFSLRTFSCPVPNM